uniref:SPRY domain-containing protein n=1 Tax=Meloidogyne incognita TaxID=6306 RepID=A0A914NHV1_MELIC
MNFVKIKNKWKEISDSETYYKCCDNKCINTNKPIGKCIKRNGFGNIIDDENIKYINCLEGGSDNSFAVFAENAFKKPQNCFNYTFYYFEIKCKCERELSKGLDWMNISLKSCSTNKHINFAAEYSSIYNEKRESFKLPTFSWNNNDIFGCGLVYPPSNKKNYKFPYVFFTQNGKQIGKGMLLKDNHDSYKPCVWVQCCSVEANFGNDLESKPFKYDVSKHFILKEFY